MLYIRQSEIEHDLFNKLLSCSLPLMYPHVTFQDDGSWPAGWNETYARQVCLDTATSYVADTCAQVVSVADLGDSILENCVENIRVCVYPVCSYPPFVLIFSGQSDRVRVSPVCSCTLFPLLLPVVGWVLLLSVPACPLLPLLWPVVGWE